MTFNKWSIGGQIFLAGLLVGWFAVLPFAIVALAPSLSAFWASASSASTPTLSIGYVLACVRLCLLWLVLALGSSTALAVYVAPDGELHRYARASLPFYAAYFILLMLEAWYAPAIFRLAPALHLSASGNVFRAGDFFLTLACGIPAFIVGKRAGQSLRQRPGSTGAQILEKWRRLPIGHGLRGEKQRLNL